MSASIFMHPDSARCLRSARGFTLIEMMVAMVLGLIVIAGVTSVFLAGQQSYRTNNALADVQDGSRIAFELMARDIREAGLTGCDTAGGRVSNVLNPSATNWWYDWGNALHGYGGAGLAGDVSDGDVDQVDPAVATGAAVGQRVAGTDSLHILSAGSIAATVAPYQGNNPARIFITQATNELASGDVIIICDPDHAAIAQITNYNTGTVTVVHNTGTGSPGNCSKGLGYPPSCTTNGNAYTFPPNAQISKLTADDWYIGNNPDGGKSLYRITVVNTSGNMGPGNPAEVVRNVTDMQITYHQVPNTDFIPAASVTNWGGVDAVKVTLTVASNFQRASVNGNHPIVRSYSATTTVRNRVD